MSLDSNEIRGMFTENEISAGIVGIYNGNYDDEDPGQTHQKSEKLEIERNRVRNSRKTLAIKAIAGAQTWVEIRQRIIKLLHRDQLEYAIARYAHHEALPLYHTAICKEIKCLEILIKGMLGKICGIELTSKLVTEIDKLCSNIRSNESKEIVYTRVSKIQRFIHQKNNLVYGENAHLTLPVHHMRNLLSTSRLHLSIVDIETKDNEYLEKIRALTAQAVNLEDCDAGNRVKSNIYWENTLSSKNYYPKWRVRHLRSIEHYFQKNVRDAVTVIESLDDDKPLSITRDNAVRIYSDMLPV